jgi:uncharacterized GH25 family protein
VSVAVLRRLALAVVLGLAASAAQAHEYWLQPDRYQAAAGDTIEVGAFAGTGFRGERKPYPAPRALRLSLTAAHTMDMRPIAVNGDLSFAHFVLPDNRGALVAFHSDYSEIELPAAEFDRYLKDQGLDGPLAARARLGATEGPGRERYGRCAKTWISPPAGDAEATRATTPVGMPLEVVPLTDPVRPGPLRVRVLYGGRPLAGALVRAWRQPLAPGAHAVEAAHRDSTGFVAEVRTDAGGTARLALSGAGEWLVSCVHMVPSENRAEADWQSLWASLTFARAATSPATASPRGGGVRRRNSR